MFTAAQAASIRAVRSLSWRTRPGVAAAGFRNASLAEGLAGSMDAGAKTGVADELFRGFKTGDIADRGEDGQAQRDAIAGDLKSEGHGILPLRGIT